MPARSTGSVRWRSGKWRTRVTIARERHEIVLSTCKEADEDKAQERSTLLADVAARLVAAGRADVTLPLIQRAAARDGKALADVIEAAKRLVAGDSSPASTFVTFGEFAERWTSGKLAKQYPDHVRSGDRKHDAARLATYVLPIVGSVALRDFNLDHADAVMSAIPSTLARATRRHVAQVMNRVLTLAAFPGRVIERSPLPKGYMPQLGKLKAMTCLYPDEDRKLLGATSIDLAHRLLYGVLAREGMRRSEAGRMTWSSVDLDRGAIRLDVNKTDDPRAWAADPGVVRALSTYRRLYAPDARPEDAVFAAVAGLVHDRGGEIVETFRSHLGEAGIDRPELFERSDVRQPIRLHDLRATFVTTSLAIGKSETWVSDRTGHRSTVMIARYRRTARQFAELDLGPLSLLDVAIPELRPVADEAGPDEGPASETSAVSSAGKSPETHEKIGVPKGGIEPPTRGFSIPCSTN